MNHLAFGTFQSYIYIHNAKSTQPQIPDVFPNHIVLCLPLSKLGISKKVISSAQSWLHSAGEVYILPTAVKLYLDFF